MRMGYSGFAHTVWSELFEKCFGPFASIVMCRHVLFPETLVSEFATESIGLARVLPSMIYPSSGKSASAFTHSARPEAAKSLAPKHEFHQPFQRDLGRPDCAAKINRFSFPPNQLHLRAIPPHRRGAYASSRYVECGLRWTRGRCAREVLQGGLRLGLGAVSD
jgi:hypothetical protein